VSDAQQRVPPLLSRCPCSPLLSQVQACCGAGTRHRPGACPPPPVCVAAHCPRKFLKSSHYFGVVIVVQMNLGTMLQEGDGCTRDVTEFKRWCARALNAAPNTVYPSAAVHSIAHFACAPCNCKANSPTAVQVACCSSAGPGESNRTHQEFRQLRPAHCA